jgi:hypothetical protein
MLNYLARIVSVRRNYLTLLLAGAFVFAGSILLEHFDIRNWFTMWLLIAASAVGAVRLRPFSLA